MHNISVPIFVDDIERSDTGDGSNEMVRCTCFIIDAVNPLPNWTLELASSGVPFMMLGLLGVIHSPVNLESTEPTIFDSEESIDTLFDTVEENEQFLISTSQIYLPYHFLLKASGGEFESHEVFRISEKLFHIAYEFAQSRCSKDQFLSRLDEQLQRRMEGLIQVSKVETKTFKAWAEKQAKIASDLFQKRLSSGLIQSDRNQPKGF